MDGRLGFYSCNDAACTGGSATDTGLGAYGPELNIDRIAIDGDGFPITVFEQRGSGGFSLHLVRCGDRDCSDASSIRESTLLTHPNPGESFGASVVLGEDGLPVITFVADSHLYVARCDDPFCANPPEMEMMAACVMHRATVAVDDSGVPFVAYQLKPWYYEDTIRVLPVGSIEVVAGECDGGGG
jgi:hypothetical protein